MTRHLQCLCATVCISLLVLSNSPFALALEKWSRQLEATEPGVSDTFDWIPLAQPVDGSSKDRSENGRVLTYSQSFPPNGRFGEFSKSLNGQISQKPSPFDFPFPFQSFNNAPQSQSLRQPESGPGLRQNNLQGQEPTSQSFFKFEMPLNQQQNVRPSQLASPGVNTGYQISHAFGNGGQATLFQSPLFNQQPVFPPEFHPLGQKPLQASLQQQKPLQQSNFIDDPLTVKNYFKENKPTQSSLSAVQPQVFPQDPQSESSFPLRSPYNSLPSGPPPSAPSAPSTPQDVQLLYVPYNDGYGQQAQAQPQSQSLNPFNPNLPQVNPYQINQFYTPDPLVRQQSNLYTSTTTLRPQTTSVKSNNNVFQNFVTSQFTTQKPKPKAHQPPLAMFLLLRSTSRPTQTDIVDALSISNRIAVIDAPTKNTPEIFVGPAGMPIPDGYTKFDLPYLSQLQGGSQNINSVAFFVAPLSYRTQQGFQKILLPEPHVGSIVINLAKSGAAQNLAAQSNLFYQPQVQDVPTTQRPRTTTQRVKISNNNNAPNRGNKYSFYYDQEPIQEVSSPQVTPKDRPKKKRPQNVKIEQPSFNQQQQQHQQRPQTVKIEQQSYNQQQQQHHHQPQQQLRNPYAQFNPVPNQIVTDDFFKLNTKPSTTSSSTSTSTSSTTTSTTSTTSAPQTYFGFPQVEFPGSSGHLYPQINQVVQEEKPRLTTRPPAASTTAEEEYRMKQYYRQQEAIRNRPQNTAQNNAPYDQVQYTPVQFEYEVSPKTTTPKPRITFFSPTTAPVPEEEDYNTLPPKQAAQPSVLPSAQANLPANHRPAYQQNEILDNQAEYDPNPYQLPSELPKLAPNLPGLVNNLKEDKDAQNQNAAEQTTIAPQTNYEQESSTRPTRRPINRTRRPLPTRASTSDSYSDVESTSRRPVNRIRRPYGSRTTSSATTNNSETEEQTASSTSTTRRPLSSRNPLLRNPNRVRYQPTPEERQTLRVKPKKKYNGSSKVVQESEDLDYQRDVLKQNYPVFKPSGSRKASSPTAIPSTYEITTTETPASETQQVYTVTPSNSIDQNDQNFPAGLLEPMQIAQQYGQYKNNYGPGYFPNQEDFNPTEPVIRNEINPVYTTLPSNTPSPTTTTTTTTTTTEAPVEITTRRSPFIRRNYPRLRTTTTETPTTTTLTPEERPSLRNRLPPRKVIKVRTRTRRPTHPASSTNAPEDENDAAATTEEPKPTYRKVNRFNHDLYDKDQQDVSRRRGSYKKFQLEGQESQWSPAVKIGPTNNFKPVNPKESTRNQHIFEEEPEIVTAGPEPDQENNYEVKVMANYGGPSVNAKPALKEPNLKPEKSFAELLEEVMGKAPEEKPTEAASTNTESSAGGTYFESQKTTIANRLNRRGKWKKIRVTHNGGQNNGESFETAESQNLGSQIFNSLRNGSQDKINVDQTKDWKTTTTPMTTAADINAMFSSSLTTTPLPLVEEFDATTQKPLQIATTPMTAIENMKMTTESVESVTTQNEESATRRMDDGDTAMEDDLEIQPSLFSEVKKQLHELFSIEESDDTAVTAALAAVGKRRQEYTNIKRPKAETTTAQYPTPTEPMSPEDKKAFHRELMKHVVYATSSPEMAKEETPTETEICYRGRCIKSDDLPANHKLQ